jgi:hypothetical protein
MYLFPFRHFAIFISPRNFFPPVAGKNSGRFSAENTARKETREALGAQLVSARPRRVDSGAWASEKEANLQIRALP